MSRRNVVFSISEVICVSDRLVIKKRGDDGYKTFSIRIKNETVDKIDKIASESNLSRNQIIQEMLDFASDKIDIQK